MWPALDFAIHDCESLAMLKSVIRDHPGISAPA